MSHLREAGEVMQNEGRTKHEIECRHDCASLDEQRTIDAPNTMMHHLVHMNPLHIRSGAKY
jgi:hypothetical protein